jgi:hypothetical protein
MKFMRRADKYYKGKWHTKRTGKKKPYGAHFHIFKHNNNSFQHVDRMQTSRRMRPELLNVDLTRMPDNDNDKNKNINTIP